MLSKSQFKLINSLNKKKYRERHGLFLAEGKKVISELLDSDLRLHALYTTEAVFEVDSELMNLVEPSELKRVSLLTTPQVAVAVFHIPASKPISSSGLKLVLDGVRDPGNLGTIIRLCDWFGIQDLICSPDTVDCYNPKVVQASMGSLSRVNLTYTNLPEFLREQDRVAYGTFMDGSNIYDQQLPEEGLIVMGNEANGISQEVEDQIDRRIAIPQFGAVRETESLNVATAAAIVLSEFKRSYFG